MRRLPLSLIAAAALTLINPVSAEDGETQPPGLKAGRVIEHSGAGSSQICVLLSEEPALPQADLKPYLRLSSGGAAVSPLPVTDGRQLCLTGLKSGTEYELTLLKGLKGKDGGELSGDKSYAFRTADLPPALKFEHGLLLPGGSNTVTLTGVNFPKTRVLVYRVSQNELKEADLTSLFEENLSVWSLNRLISRQATLLADKVIDTSGEPNQEQLTEINLSDFNASDKSGVYVIAALSPDIEFDGYTATSALDSKMYLAKLLYVTDIGVTSYKSAAGIDIAVRSLKDAAPIPDANVKLVSEGNTTLGTAATDENGYAHFEAFITGGKGAAAPRLVAVGKDNDYFTLDLNEEPLSLEQKTARAAQGDEEHRIFAYTDRGIYRPGETVHYTAFIRDGALKATDLEAIKLRILRPDGVEYRALTLKPEGAGAFSFNLELPARSLTGPWTFDLMPDGANTLSSTAVAVQTFTPAGVNLNLTDPKAALNEKGPSVIALQADFNYGAPGAGLKPEADAWLEPDPHPFADFGDFHFGPSPQDEQGYGSYVSLSGAPCDDEGKCLLTGELKKAPYPRQATVLVNVLDGGSAVLKRAFPLKVKKDGALIGVKKLPDGDRASFAVVSLDSEGRALPAEVSYRLERVIADWQFAFENNAWRYIRSEHALPVAAGTINAAADKDSALISAALENGSYRLTLTQGEDCTVYDFYEGYSTLNEARTPDTFVLTADKPSYQAGEEIKLEFDALKDGYADLALGSSGLKQLSHHQVTKGHNVITLKASEDFGVGVHALLTLYAPLTGLPTPARAVGEAYIALDAQNRILDVKAELPAVLRPGESADIPLSVKGGSGKTYYTACLVDTGILQLTDFKAPRPEEDLLKPLNRTLEIRDMYGYLIRRARETGQGYGDEAQLRSMGAEAIELLNRRNIVACQDLSELKDGKGTVHFDLPKHQGGLKLMVAACNETAVGSFEADTKVHGETASLLNLPSVLHQGDKAEAALSLHALERDNADYQISISCEGALSCSPGDFKAHLNKGERTLLRFTAEAAQSGEGRISYKIADADRYSFEDSREILVKHSIPELFSQQVLSLNPGEEKHLKPELSYEGEPSVFIEQGALPYVNVPLFIKSLKDSEATDLYSNAAAVSGIISAYFAGGYKQDDDQDPALRALAAAVQQKVGLIEALLTPSGYPNVYEAGWSSDSYAVPYAARALFSARKAGFAVNPAALRALSRALDDVSRADGSTAAIAALELLSEEGARSLAQLRYLFDKDSVRSVGGLNALARAFHLQGDLGRRDQALAKAARALTKELELESRLALENDPAKRLQLASELHTLSDGALSSVIYDSFDLINALVLCDKPELMALPLDILGQSRTLNSQLSLPCMELLLRTQSLLGSDQKTIRREGTPDVKGEIVLNNETDAQVFASVGILGYPQTLPPNEAGNTLKLTFLSRDGAELPRPYALSPNENICIRAKLELSAPIRGPLKLTVPLPAGFALLQAGSYDELLKVFPHLAYTDKVMEADGTVNAVFEDFMGRSLEFVLTAAPSYEGTFLMPACAAQSMGGTLTKVFSEPLTVKVTARAPAAEGQKSGKAPSKSTDAGVEKNAQNN